MAFKMSSRKHRVRCFEWQLPSRGYNNDSFDRRSGLALAYRRPRNKVRRGVVASDEATHAATSFIKADPNMPHNHPQYSRRGVVYWSDRRQAFRSSTYRGQRVRQSFPAGLKRSNPHERKSQV